MTTGITEKGHVYMTWGTETCRACRALYCWVGI